MNTSPQAAKQIAQFEGIRLHPYNDVAGNATVGVGHLIHRGPLNGTEDSVTEDQALSVFEQDLKSKAEVFVSRVRVPLNQNQFDALTSGGTNTSFTLNGNNVAALVSAGARCLIPDFIPGYETSGAANHRLDQEVYSVAGAEICRVDLLPDIEESSTPAPIAPPRRAEAPQLKAPVEMKELADQKAPATAKTWLSERSPGWIKPR